MGERYVMTRYALWERGKVIDPGPYSRKMAMLLARSLRRKTGRSVYARGSKTA